MGKDKVCHRPDCKAEFKPLRKNQVYCHANCKREMERRQRVASRVYKEIMEKGLYRRGEYDG